MSRICTGTTQEHRDASDIIDLILASGGTTTLSNRRIVTKLGINMPRFVQARRHSLRCTGLDGHTVPYRDRRTSSLGSMLVVLDPYVSVHESAIESLARRVTALKGGQRSMARMVETIRRRATAFYQAARDEALGRGESSLAGVLDQCMADMDRDGRVHPSTWSLLETELARAV